MQLFNLTNNPVKKVVLRLEPRVFFLWNTSQHIEFSFEKPFAGAHIFALFTGNNADAFDLSIVQHHQQPDTQSFLTVLGILNGQSRLSYSGLIRIEPEAVRTNAAQTNRNLLLSDQASASASPTLEILADDVSARHASATGTTNAESVFALETRGIDRSAAEKLLAEGAVRNFFETMRAHTDDAEIDLLEQAALKSLSL